MGHDYDVYLYRDRAACPTMVHSRPNHLYSSATSNMPESLRWTEQLGVDDSGVYYIIVRRFAGSSCTESYTLTVNGLN